MENTPKVKETLAMSNATKQDKVTQEQIKQMKASLNAFKTHFYGLKAEWDAFQLHFSEIEANWIRIMAELETQESDGSTSQSAIESKQDFNALNDFKTYADENQKQTTNGFSFGFGSAFSKLKEKASEAKEAIEKSGVLDKVKEKTNELANKGLEKGKGLIESQRQKGADNGRD